MDNDTSYRGYKRIRYLIAETHRKRLREIRSRILEFALKRRRSDEELFEELCFCICTPQTRARSADSAIRMLRRNANLLKSGESQIREALRQSGVRFFKKKANYIVKAREFFSNNGRLSIYAKLPEESFKARQFLVSNIYGIGYKEASHFLRNIGYKGLAILDRHVMSVMVELGVSEKIPKSLSRKRYLELERTFLGLARSLGIKPESLDLVMWSLRTGEIFK